MRYPILALAGLTMTLAACDTTTPAQRCVGYTGAVMRYEAMLDRGEVLSDVQRAAYDIALAGKAATCVTSEP